ncbi:MAG TPA: hypothetical protein VFV38_14635 [Ktedonobacteraceae bacterium]|nr:hypothetical protein [Ktedonobacteraceae bacterium]
MEQRLAHLWANVPWLLRRFHHLEAPVRHNLHTSFFEQIKGIIGQETVEELWVFAPFFDEKAVALATLVKTIRPARTILLLQSGYVSVDQRNLQEVIDHLPSNCEIRPLKAKDGPLYLHAKLYLFKLANRALCVQGSPNISQVAMLLHNPQGNIEVANFLTGPRDAFDNLLDDLPLTIGASQTNLSGLELTYQKKETAEEDKKQPWELLGGEWQDDYLWLHVRGVVPDLREASLVVRGQVFPVHQWKEVGQTLELKVQELVKELLAELAPVSIRWDNGSQACETNPIIPCDKRALDHILQQEEPKSAWLERSADLNLNDQDFDALLGELHDVLAIDQESIWNATNKSTKTQQGIQDEKGLHLRYDEIDYEVLRSHPKIRQYLERNAGIYGNTQTRIGIILHAIAKHMQGLLQQEEIEVFAATNAAIPSSEVSEDEPFSEGEPGYDGGEAVRHWSVRARIRKVLSRFIHRYLRGFASPTFQQLVGYEVMTKNYLIFSQLLWRLFAKDWLEYYTIVEAFIQLRQLFWGDQTSPGYFYQLSIDEQLEIWQWMRDYRNDALILATYYYSAIIVVKKQQENLRFSLRESWRNLLGLSPFPLTVEVMEDAQKLLASLLPYRPPKSVEIVSELAQLAYFETPRHIIAHLVASGFFPAGSGSFKKMRVWRGTLGQEVSVDCLVIDYSEALSTKESALALLMAWMQMGLSDYYRIITKEPNTPYEYTYLIFYDLKEQRGKYAARVGIRSSTPDTQNIPHIQLPTVSWNVGLIHLHELVQQIPVTADLARANKTSP